MSWGGMGWDPLGCRGTASRRREGRSSARVDAESAANPAIPSGIREGRKRALPHPLTLPLRRTASTAAEIPGSGEDLSHPDVGLGQDGDRAEAGAVFQEVDDAPSSATAAAPASPAALPAPRPWPQAASSATRAPRSAPQAPRSARPGPRPAPQGHHRAATRSQPAIIPAAAPRPPVKTPTAAQP